MVGVKGKFDFVVNILESFAKAREDYTPLFFSLPFYYLLNECVYRPEHLREREQAAAQDHVPLVGNPQHKLRRQKVYH